jgi:hypothetical protein
VALLDTYVGEQFGQIVSVEANFWRGTLAVATFQLEKNIGRLPEDLVEMLLRYGFAARAWEEALGIANDGAATTSESLSPTVREPAVGKKEPNGTLLETDTWLKDASIVCTNPFENLAERILELSTIELLGIQRVVDRYMNKPWQGHDPAVVAGVANARLGYALRNRETQLVECYGQVHVDDPLADLAAERAENSGIKTAVVHRIIRDVIDFGDVALLYRSTPGTTAETRRGVFEQWAEEHFPGDDPRFGQAITIALIEHGYFLHRLFEIQPELLDS